MRLFLLLTLAAIGLGGCKSMSPTEPAVAARDDGIDRAKMAVIEQQAQRGGVQVHWVNPPRKPSQ